MLVWAARQPRPIDIAGSHAILVFLVVPAVLTAAWGRWLPFALTLVCVGAFMYLSVLVAGQISN